MSAPSTAWKRVLTTVAMAGLLATAALSVGCGVSPAYEPEPRVPGLPGEYTRTNPPNPEPPTSEQLAQAQQAQPPAGEIALGGNDEEYADTDPSALTDFKPALEGHGQWVDDAAYGTVWVPAESEVGTDFVPYTTSGHWTYSDQTNYVWVSDYSWGWAPFHYGRWIRASYGGWAWIPGRTYAGAWVDWRYGGPEYGYVGWGPASPLWYWSDGAAVAWTFGYSPYYSYCHRDYLYNPYVGGHVVVGYDPRARDYAANTRPYVPAHPSVGPGRVAATPHVGPHPAEIGMRAESVTAPPASNAGLARAQGFATPRTAVAQGGTPPAQTQARRRPFDHDSVASAPAPRQFDGRGPATSSRVDAVARAPQVAGVSPRPAVASSRSFSDRPSGSTSYRSAPGSAGSPSSTFRGNPSASASAFHGQSSSQPTFHSAPTASSPSFHGATSATAHTSTAAVAAVPPHTSAPAVPRPSSSRSSGRVRSR